MHKIRKAVFPVAGLGTRFLPVTKAVPKEMLPIVDKPLIQYAVEEAAACGITDFIFVTSRNKRAIKDHFDKNFDLESKLSKKNKIDLLKRLQNIIPAKCNCVFVWQKEPLGLGHAVLCAKNIIGNEPFALILPDDMIDNKKQSCLSQMLDVYHETGQSVLALKKIDLKESKKYGIVGLEQKDLKLGNAAKITNIIEKPDPQNAPSKFASVGRYLLNSAIFNYLEKVKPGVIGEIQITDGILGLLKEQDVYGYLFHGINYDCGSKLGYLQATINYARKHPEIGKEFTKYLATL